MNKKKKKDKKPEIPRVTIQLYPPLYKAIHGSAIKQKKKTYELINELMVIGITEYSKNPNNATIPLTDKDIAEALKIALPVKK